jgi:geranylgeranyl transferase type-2 subunit beta
MEELPTTTTTPKEAEGEKELRLAEEAHKGYIRRLSGKTKGFEHWVTEHLKMSGLYWGLCALDMLDALPTDDDDGGAQAANKEEQQQGAEDEQRSTPAEGAGEEAEEAKGPKRKELVAWVLACQRENGGFGGSIGHDAHLLYTLSAIQVRPSFFIYFIFICAFFSNALMDILCFKLLFLLK